MVPQSRRHNHHERHTRGQIVKVVIASQAIHGNTGDLSSWWNSYDASPLSARFSKNELIWLTLSSIVVRPLTKRSMDRAVDPYIGGEGRGRWRGFHGSMDRAVGCGSDQFWRQWKCTEKGFASQSIQSIKRSNSHYLQFCFSTLSNPRARLPHLIYIQDQDSTFSETPHISINSSYSRLWSGPNHRSIRL